MKAKPKSEKVGTAKNGNIPKHSSYAEAHKRIKESIEKEFFFEAIVIEESIISDRLYSYLEFREVKLKSIEKHSFFELISKSKNIITPELFHKLEIFRNLRNKATHQICKSQPGTPPKNIVSFLDDAKEAAELGKELTREIEKLTKH